MTFDIGKRELNAGHPFEKVNTVLPLPEHLQTNLILRYKLYRISFQINHIPCSTNSFQFEKRKKDSNVEV